MPADRRVYACTHGLYAMCDWQGMVFVIDARVCACALQEEDKQLIRDKIAEVFAAGNAEQARRRFDKEACGRAGVRARGRVHLC
jgi:hypothetical protein